MLDQIKAFFRTDFKDTESVFRLLFICTYFVFLIAMPIMSVTTSLNGDARFHLPQSQHIMDFYLTLGKDRTIIHSAKAFSETQEYKDIERQYLMENFQVDAVSKLNERQKQEFKKATITVTRHRPDFRVDILRGYEDKWIQGDPRDYGNFYEFFAGVYYKVMGVDKPHDPNFLSFRRILNSFFGLIIILFTGLLAQYLGGWRAGLIAIVFLFLSPRYLGNMFMNIKDIPMATGYIIAIYFMVRFIDELPLPRGKIMAGLIAGIAIALNMRAAGGLLLIAYLLMFCGVAWMIYSFKQKKIDLNFSYYFPVIKRIFLVVVLGYVAGLLFYPYALLNPLTGPFESLGRQSNFQTTMAILFDGEKISSGLVPWYYVPKWVAISSPVVVIVGFVLLVAVLFFFRKRIKLPLVLIVLFAALFPVFYVIYKKSNLYGAWRHLFFIYAPIVVLSALGWVLLIGYFKNRYVKIALGVLIAASLIKPALWIIEAHPVEYVYFNEFVGGTQGAKGKYTMDYTMQSVRPAVMWLAEKENLYDTEDTILIATDCSYATIMYFKNVSDKIKVRYARYYDRNDKEWDYGLFYSEFVSADQQKNDTWITDLSIHTIDAGGVPLMTILKRENQKDYLATQAIKENNFEKAKLLATEALQEQPGNEGLWSTLGIANLNTGDINGAISAFSKSIQIYKENPTAMYYLGAAYFYGGDYDKSIYVLNRLIEINPRFAQAYQLIGESYAKKGNNAMAKRYMDFARQLQ